MIILPLVYNYAFPPNAWRTITTIPVGWWLQERGETSDFYVVGSDYNDYSDYNDPDYPKFLRLHLFHLQTSYEH